MSTSTSTSTSTWIAFASLLSCGYAHHDAEDPLDAGPAADGDAAIEADAADASPDCPGLDEARCAATDRCAPMKAMAPGESAGSPCLGERAFVACVGSRICGDAMTAACPTGTTTVTLIMPTTCLPDGFVECPWPWPGENTPPCP